MNLEAHEVQRQFLEVLEDAPTGRNEDQPASSEQKEGGKASSQASPASPSKMLRPPSDWGMQAKSRLVGRHGKKVVPVMDDLSQPPAGIYSQSRNGSRGVLEKVPQPEHGPNLSSHISQ